MNKAQRILVLSLLCVTCRLSAVPSEYHWTVCESSAEDVIEKLDADVSKEVERTVHYFDTEKADLYRAGVSLRARQESDEQPEMTAKIDANAQEIPAKFHEEEDFKCELDFLGEERESHCSLTDEASAKDLKAVVGGSESPELLFSKLQRELLREIKTKIPWTSLETYKVQNTKWKLKTDDGKLDLEEFRVGKRSLLELSTKDDPGSPAKFKKLSKWITATGLKLCAKPVGKTGWALGLSERP